ncbi:uncharacterized protein LOC106872607 [Octopus bimaculoides]|uniref:uncharacterized protein LOC106872607 n=1 Tax=Octopus bimaculoides TaxID=37653 RepID=UPI00071E3E61|nr:uncharacterized protein LOC106872607 [Octopus bimaculoides]|eukprot:XP_014775129.1 PREDICTED: uncharacterized protein LOC106872607 [Octopus bimaculoides]
MRFNALLVACTYCSLLIAAAAAVDRIICSTSAQAGKPLPTLPVAYSVRLEVNEITNNRTVEIHAYVDDRTEKVAVRITSEISSSFSIFNFKTNQLIITQSVTDDDLYNCNVEKIVGDDVFAIFRHLFELNKLDPSNLPKNFQDNIKYLDSSEVHGEIVEGWEICDTINAETNKISLYFSADGWITASGAKHVPVRCNLISQTTQNGKLINNEYLIELSDFDPTPPDYKIFEIPKETYCKGSAYKKDLPKVKDAFSCGIERIDLGAKYPIRLNQYIYYDFKKKLFRLDYFENIKGNPGYLEGQLTQIHDYNTDTAYIIRKNDIKCEMKSIEEISDLYKQIDITKTRLRNNQEILQLDKSKYIYEGQRTVRGILCDVWIAHRDDYPLPKSTLSVWEWYFASDDAVLDIGEREETNFPVRLEIKHDESKTYAVLNFYNYDEDFQLYSTFDIDKCFGVENRLDYSFEIIGSFDSIVNEDEETLKYEIRFSLSEIGKLSPLRLSNIQIDEGENTVVVSFSLLDVPPGNKGNETDLHTAAKKLVDEISNNELVITRSKDKISILEKLSCQKVLLGAMAGLGIGMLIVGGLIGYAVGKFLVKKKKESAFKGMRFENLEKNLSSHNCVLFSDHENEKKCC